MAVGRGGELDPQNSKAALLDPATGKKIRELTPGHLGGLTDLVFHPDSKHLFSSARDTVVRIWSVTDNGRVPPLFEISSPAGGAGSGALGGGRVALNPKDKEVIIGGGQGVSIYSLPELFD